MEGEQLIQRPPVKPKRLGLKISLGVCVFFALVVGAMCLDVQLRYRNRLVKAEDTASTTEAIIVLGAALKTDGTPSDALRDRLETGVALYKIGKAPKLLLTGDDGKNNMDEVSVMRQYAIDHGVPESAVRVDGQGYRTYESCSRAVQVLNIKKAILVTQNFHLPRALYLCNRMGMEAVGVSADLNHYENWWWNQSRDLLASVKAWWDVNVVTPKPPV